MQDGYHTRLLRGAQPAHQLMGGACSTAAAPMSRAPSLLQRHHLHVSPTIITLILCLAHLPSGKGAGGCSDDLKPTAATI